MKPDGYIRIDTKIDTAGANAGLAGLTSKLKGFGGLIAATFASVAVAGVTKFAGACVELASDLEEVQNVVDVTFGEASAKINAFAKTADKAFGLSELKVKKYTSTIGAMVKSMGFAEKEAADMAKTITGLAGDMASFYNLDPDEAFNKLRSGISGETEPLKQLGINLSVANLEAYALAQGMTRAYESMTEAEKATLRYNYILQATKDSQGDFSRTSDSLANQQRILALEFDKLKTTIGQALMPVITSAVGAINGLVENLNSIGQTTDAARALDEVAASAGRTEAQSAAAGKVALGYIDTLEQLAAQGLTTAEAQQEYATTVARLNALVPGLNVTIDEQTGLIKQSTGALRDNVEAWKEVAMAQALQDRYKDIIAAFANAQAEVTENEIQLQAVQDEMAAQAAQLSVIFLQMAESIGLTGDEAKNFVDSLLESEGVTSEMTDQLRAAGVSSEYLGNELWDLREALINNIGSERMLTEDIKYGKEQMGKYEAEVSLAEEATKKMMDTSKDAAPVVHKQATTFKDLAAQAKTVTEKTDVLKKALDQQTEAGTLSVDMVNALIAAGYQAAIQVDKETGAVTLNRDAYIKLTNAQYDQLIAKAELAKKDLVGKIDAERAAVEKLAQADLAAAYAVLMLAGAQEKDVLAYEAQIATLKAAKSEIGKYTASVGSAAGGASRAVDKAADKFQEAVKKIDRALELGEITQEEYWQRYADLMADSLKEGTEAWTDANHELQKGQRELFTALEDTARDSLQNIKDEYDDAFSSIQDNIRSLADQIASIDLVDEIKDKDFGSFLEFTDIGDLQAGNTELEKYAENIKALQEMGVSSSLLSQISQLDTTQANAYMQYLINLGTEGFEAYLVEWERRQELAQEAAKLFYQEELAILETEFADKLTGALDTLQEQGKSLGEGVAAGIVAGIMSGQMAVEQAVMSVLGGAINGAASLGGVSMPSGGLPHLAEGAVLPPNRKFLAVLGDQRSGTNIEAPLSTIKQAMAEVLGQSGTGGDTTVTIPVYLDNREIYRGQKKIGRQQGASLVKE